MTLQARLHARLQARFQISLKTQLGLRTNELTDKQTDGGKGGLLELLSQLKMIQEVLPYLAVGDQFYSS